MVNKIFIYSIEINYILVFKIYPNYLVGVWRIYLKNKLNKSYIFYYKI